MKRILTPEFRVSFPAILKPAAFEGQEPKYSVTMLFDKKTDISALKQLAAETAKQEWPDPTKAPKNLRNPFRDGSDKPDLQGYENCIFLKATSKQPVGIVNQAKQPITSEVEFYPGCYAHAYVTCFAYNKAGNAGVGFGLQSIQKTRDGEPFSGKGNAANDFDVIAPSGDDILF